AASSGPSAFLPSKLVDYLPYRKPILGVTPAAGASATLVRALGCPVADPADVDAIVAALDDLIARWRGGTPGAPAASDEAAGAFDIRHTTARLHDALARAFAP